MNNSHIIIGYGNWAKKIIKFLKRNNFFSRIIVVTRKKQFFIFPKYKKIARKDLNNIFLKAKSVHICSNNRSHFLYIKLAPVIKQVLFLFIIENDIILTF